MLNERDMKRIENAVRGTVPKAVSFGVRGVANQDTGYGTMVEFGIMSRDERKGTTTNLSKMRQRRFTAVPEFIGCFTIVGRSASKISEVRGSDTKFIPQIKRGGTGRVHGPCFVHERAVESFSMPVVGRSVGGSEEMKYTFLSTPLMDLK